MKRIRVSIAIAVAFSILGYILGTLFGLDNMQGRAFLLAVLAFGMVLGLLFDWLLEEAARRNRELMRQMDDLRDNLQDNLQMEKPVLETRQIERIQIERVQQQIAPLTTANLPAGDNQSDEIVSRTLADFLRRRDEELKELRQHLDEANRQKQIIREKAIRQVQISQEKTNQRVQVIQKKAIQQVQVVQKGADQHIQAIREEADQRAQTIRDRANQQTLAIRHEFDAYVKIHPDDLTKIKGIGLVYQRKLRDIGVNTFKQLSEADPKKLRRKLGIKDWQNVDVAVWIEQSFDWIE